jgi:uridine phosphorylase
MPARLRPTAPIAGDAILVGDPGRALMLAQELLTQPKMSNHARGLWGYSGETEAGERLTVQATGMGGPSARVVLHDLAELGLRRAVRVGTCTSLGSAELGELLVASAANREQPDPGLTGSLREQLGDGARDARVVSLDTLHRHAPATEARQGDVVDMQTAALFAAAGGLGVAVAAVLIVTETDRGATLSDEDLEKATKRAGWAAASILSPSS